jgi:hypothetical protein
MDTAKDHSRACRGHLSQLVGDGNLSPVTTTPHCFIGCGGVQELASARAGHTDSIPGGAYNSFK